MKAGLHSARVWSRIILFLCGLCSSTGLLAQNNVPENKVSLSGFPVLYFTPETKLAFGAAGSVVLHGFEDSAHGFPSQFQIGAAYTLNHQFLLYLPFRYYSPANDFVFYGEAGYYRYSYYFYGIGNHQPKTEKELYEVNYPRIRINALRKVNQAIYIGLRVWFENYDIVKTEPGKELATDASISGARGSRTLGVGPAVNIDTRNDVFWPASGWFVDAAMQLYGNATGSDFNYNRYTLDATRYLAIGKKSVLALNAFFDAVSGNAPFSQLAVLGGNKKMRGFYEGRFRDKDLLAFGEEFRFPLPRRFGAVVFLNEGSVSGGLADLFSYPRMSYGAGLRYRLKKSENLNLRLDYALASHSSGFYFTIGEAF